MLHSKIDVWMSTWFFKISESEKFFNAKKKIFPLFTSSNIFPDSDFEQKKLAVLLNVKCVKKINLIQNFSKIKSDVFKKLPIQ